MEKFIILCRYEHWTERGKAWCKWYVVVPNPKTQEQALERIESLKASSTQTARVTKLKYEFKTLSVKNTKGIKTRFGALTEQKRKCYI